MGRFLIRVVVAVVIVVVVEHNAHVCPAVLCIFPQAHMHTCTHLSVTSLSFHIQIQDTP
jgi:hypothetical protein